MAFEITVPRLGWSMEEGTFAGWQKKDGDVVRPGEVLFELEGEKALQEVEALDGGILRLLPNGPTPGTVLKVGSVVGYLVAEGEVLPAGTNTEPRSFTKPRAEIMHLSQQPEQSPNRIPERSHAPLANLQSIATPRARRAAARMGVDWTTLTGSGKNGRIRERDVLAAATSVGAGSSASQVTGRRVPVSGRRQVIADRLSESARRTVPVTITTRADATNLMSLREQFKSTGQKPVPAIHDIVAKLVAAELIQFPMMAARWDGDAIVLSEPQDIHVSLAVDTDDGLLVPVLRHVTSTPLVALTEESSRLIKKARDGRLSSAEMQGGVFTISNLGSFGIDFFTPVINLPETAILGLGAIRREPVVANDGQVVVRHMMSLSLTFDHRVIDGAPAAKFLQALVAAIASPAARLLAAS